VVNLEIASIDRRAAVRPTWRQLLAARAHGIFAVDFADVDTVFLRWAYVLVVIEHVTPRTHLAGITTHPTGHVTQQARNLLRLGRLSVLRRDARPGPRPPSTSRAASARGSWSAPDVPRSAAERCSWTRRSASLQVTATATPRLLPRRALRDRRDTGRVPVSASRIG
jgi:hypothetical protein